MSTARHLQSTLTIGNYVVKRLDDIRTLLVDNKAVKFTPTEYRLLLHLLEGQPVSDKELFLALFTNRIEDDLWAREALKRHLDNIRQKLKKCRFKIHIRRIAAFGYILLPDPPLRRR